MIQLVLSTCPADHAARLARAVVEERLAACCNRLPAVQSTYWWDGQVEEADEVLLVFKTTSEQAPRLMERLGALHPYDVPEIVVLPVARVNAPYAAWVQAEARSLKSS